MVVGADGPKSGAAVLADTSMVYSVKQTRPVSVSVVSAVLTGKEEPEGVYWIRYSMMIPLWNSSGGGDHERKTDMKDRGTAVRSSGAASGAGEGGGELMDWQGS